MKKKSKPTNGERSREKPNLITLYVSDIIMSALEDAAIANDSDVNGMVTVILSEWVLQRDAILNRCRR